MKHLKVKFCLIWFCLFLCVSLAAQNRSDSLHVIHYDLTLDMTDFTNRQLSGVALLKVKSKMDNISQITLDLKALAVDSVLVDGDLVEHKRSDDKLLVPVNGFNKNDTVLLSVFYHGKPVADDRWGGFYFSGEYAYNMGVAFNDIPHNFGRCWFPCMDVFIDKSTYTTHIRTEAHKKAICGGLLTDSTRLLDSTVVWTWELSQPVPTYLVSLAVGDYVLCSDTFQGKEAVIPISIYVQPERALKVSASFAHLKDILRMYERLFGPYRWSRVGYVAVAFSSGAMEHACNIAYPQSAVDSTENSITLYGHELFHHWFGNLITCKSAEEMWINEGFATYSESLVMSLLQGDKGYADYMRDMHRSTLFELKERDGAFYALDSVPLAYTYGMHSYDKGALVVHTLRNYLGDSLFFSGMRSLLEHYAFKNLSSKEMFVYLSEQTGVNLLPFYEGWVNQPGWLDFSVDSLVSLGNGNYRVYLQQKLYGAYRYADSNRVDLSFVSSDREIYTVSNVSFSGRYDSVELRLPFEPLFAIVDLNEKISDATVDANYILTEGYDISFGEAYCNLSLQSFEDTLLVRIEHHLVSPDMPESADELPEGIHRVSTHYWNVQFAYDKNRFGEPDGYLQFRFLSANQSQPDYELFEGGYRAPNLKLLYRPDAGTPWKIVPVTRGGSNFSGTLKTSSLKSGEYCLAVGEKDAGTDNVRYYDIKVYPNPVKNVLILHSESLLVGSAVQILDVTGKVLKRFVLKSDTSQISIRNFASGTYLLKVLTPDGVLTRTFIKN